MHGVGQKKVAMTQYVKPTLDATLATIAHEDCVPSEDANVGEAISRIVTFLEERYEQDLPYASIVNHQDPFSKQDVACGTPDIEILEHKRPAVAVLLVIAGAAPVRDVTTVHKRAIGCSGRFAHVVCVAILPPGYKRGDHPELGQVVIAAEDENNHFILIEARKRFVQPENPSG